MLTKVKIDDSGTAPLPSALNSHTHLAQALQPRDEVALFRVFEQVVLETIETGVVGDLHDEAREERQLNEGQFHLTLTT